MRRAETVQKDADMSRELTKDMLASIAEELAAMTLAKPSEKAVYKKIRITRLGMTSRFFAEKFTATQSFHGTFSQAELLDFLQSNVGAIYKDVSAQTFGITGKRKYVRLLTNKKGRTVVLTQPAKEQTDAKTGAAQNRSEKTPSENAAAYSISPEFQAQAADAAERHFTPARRKHYIIKEGVPVPYLVKLGIMTASGNIIAKKYGKFRQINRFLEFADDILPDMLAARKKRQELSAAQNQNAMPNAAENSEPLRIIDFGCGKSYLTFALYHYLTEIRGISADITGVDLKQSVIEVCEKTAAECGCRGLHFLCADINSFRAQTVPDLVISLHACDTATDSALAYAVSSGAGAVLSVPCCQHELNAALNASDLRTNITANPFLALLKHGIIKERFASLATDVMRAELLEQAGYKTQILEFIDTEHTPKNLLIRAVKKTAEAPAAKPSEAYTALRTALGSGITLETLLRRGNTRDF
ncbi:MAG: SAM-dependent methyltransferase [Bacteroides sp.]|nr:SAM-dependent methyltransferase [Prevotella sp.]MCM1407680.1 SAM-dependent methyltransferase [Treponema brennaborense]MCM1469170.1 SAM-dependent methyltransferase [Bacteroides sp.]